MQWPTAVATTTHARTISALVFTKPPPQSTDHLQIPCGLARSRPIRFRRSPRTTPGAHRLWCVGPVEVNARGPRSVGPGHGEEREEPVALVARLVVPEEVAGEGLPLDVRGLLQVERGGGQALPAAPVGRVGRAAGRCREAARPVEDDPAIGQRAGAGVLLRKSS